MFDARRKGPSGRMRKNDMSMIKGKKAETIKDVLTFKANVLVKNTYTPAPARPAPPVPEPQAARLKEP